jgi:polysaccharide pyruvyl transferase WcaK-like protein
VSGRRATGPPATRVGLWGALGTGNLGNDASLESVLAFLRAEHPDAELDAMCGGPAEFTRAYGVTAVPLSWYHAYEERVFGLRALPLKLAAKVIDVFRTVAWVRRHDVVIVPGMGILETTLPLRALGFPYSFFLLCWSGRALRVKVALVSVGANVMRQPLTRWLFVAGSRLAAYRSYRDDLSRTAMRAMGLDTAGDHVFADLVFALPAPPAGEAGPRAVGVGVMEFRGTNDERRQADQIYASYLAGLTRFIVWLADSGRDVRLFVGDTNGSDDGVVQEIITAVRAERPDLAPDRLVSAPAPTFSDLMAAMAPVDTVVATRYHNVICALMLAKPTISVGYGEKHDVLMADFEQAEFRQAAGSVDPGRLIEQFTELERRSAEVRATLAEHRARHAHQVAAQFAELSGVLFREPAEVREAVAPQAGAYGSAR